MKFLYIVVVCVLIGLVGGASAQDTPKAKAPTCEQQLAQVKQDLAIRNDYVGRLNQVRTQQETAALTFEHMQQGMNQRIKQLEQELAKAKGATETK